MTAIIILIAILLLLNVLIIMLYVRVCKRLPSDFDADYYDENGNHIYYDRKLIRQLEKEKKEGEHPNH